MMYSIQDSELKLVIPKNWVITWTRVSHASTGGCTNGFWTVAVVCRHNIQNVTRPDLPQRQLAGAWNSMHDGTSAEVVRERTNNEVGVHRLDAHTISTWGLCPVKTASTTFVVGPGTFSSTKFVRRRLKASEIFLAWDLPLHVVEQSSVKFLKRNVDTIMASPPCKILQGVGAAWFNREKPGGEETHEITETQGTKHMRSTTTNQDIRQSDPLTVKHSEINKFIPFSKLPGDRPQKYYPHNIEMAILKELNNKAPIRKDDIRLCLHSIEHDYSTAAAMRISIEDYRAGKLATTNKEKEHENESKAEDGNHKMDNAKVPTHIWDNFLERGWGKWVVFGESNPKK